MNYIKLINGFWQVRRERPDFDPYVIALYFALVDIANRRDWKPFTAYRDDIIALSGMSAKPYYKARAILKESGLIEFKEGASKKIMCCFTINEPLPTVTVATTEGATVATTLPPTVGDTVATTEATTILNKHINSKTNKPLNKEDNASLSPPLFKDENSEGLKAEPKKPKEKSSAKKEKVLPHLFTNSQYHDLQTFIAAFDAVQYAHIDLPAYHESIRGWSAENGAKKVDWIETAKNWMRRDKEKGCLKMKSNTYRNNGQSNNTFGQKSDSGNKPTGAELAYLIAS